MTTTFVADNRNILDECDATTGWTGSDAPEVSTAVEIESTGCLAMQVSTATEDAYTSITSDDYSGGGTLSVWMRPRGEMDTTSGGGVMIVVGDGTNRIGYHVGGSDQTGFAHGQGPIEWACFVLDLANKPANFTAFAGSEANLNEAAITQVGVAFKTLSKSVGGVVNCFWDIIRFADNGNDIIFRGGTTSGAAGNGAEAAVIDRSTGNQQAYGVIRELASGVYGIQGNITLGDTTSSSDQYWAETNATYAWEDRGLSANNYYRFALVGSSTATNCEFSFTATTFVVPTAASASFNGNGADITSCTMASCTFIGFDQGIETSDDTTDDWEACAYVDNGQIVANGCLMNNSNISGYVGAANTSALLWNINQDPDGELDGCDFTMGSASTHAIEFGTTSPLTMTLRNVTFNGYNTSTNNQNDSTLHFKRTSGTITLNIVGGDTPTYRTDGATVNIVANPVDVTVTVTTTGGTVIQNARVLVEASNGTGPFPYQEAITITNSTTTATATHTGHGLVSNDKVVIRGATQTAYNGVFQITVTDANTYTYTMSSDPGGSATGSPVSSFVAVEGLTNASGVVTANRVYSSNQPVVGTARKATGSPLYKPAVINGTVNSSTGFNTTVPLISDE